MSVANLQQKLVGYKLGSLRGPSIREALLNKAEHTLPVLNMQFMFEGQGQNWTPLSLKCSSTRKNRSPILAQLMEFSRK
jgi:hypothetical protein